MSRKKTWKNGQKPVDDALEMGQRAERYRKKYIEQREMRGETRS